MELSQISLPHEYRSAFLTRVTMFLKCAGALFEAGNGQMDTLGYAFEG